MVDEIFVERPIEKSQGFSVLESDIGNIGATDLERHRLRSPGGEECGIRVPMAPGIHIGERSGRAHGRPRNGPSSGQEAYGHGTGR